MLVLLSPACETVPKKNNSHMILRSLGRPLIRDQFHFTISKSYMKLLKIFTFSAENPPHKLYFKSFRNVLYAWFWAGASPDASAVSI